MAQNLPPKKSDADKLVTKEHDVQLVLDGKKKAARRNGRYADPGENFELQGRTFQVTNVYEQPLGEMTDTDARSEGFENKEAYKNYILSLHPGMPFLPHMKVWVHEFREEK